MAYTKKYLDLLDSLSRMTTTGRISALAEHCKLTYEELDRIDNSRDLYTPSFVADFITWLNYRRDVFHCDVSPDQCLMWISALTDALDPCQTIKDCIRFGRKSIIVQVFRNPSTTTHNIIHNTSREERRKIPGATTIRGKQK